MPVTRKRWLESMADAGLPFVCTGMGTARSDAPGRFATFKRRLVATGQAEIDGVEWSLWLEDGGQRHVAAWRDACRPTPEALAVTLALLRGWLGGRWSAADAVAAVGGHPRMLAVG